MQAEVELRLREGDTMTILRQDRNMTIWYRDKTRLREDKTRWTRQNRDKKNRDRGITRKFKTGLRLKHATLPRGDTMTEIWQYGPIQGEEDGRDLDKMRLRQGQTGTRWDWDKARPEQDDTETRCNRFKTKSRQDKTGSKRYQERMKRDEQADNTEITKDRDTMRPRLRQTSGCGDYHSQDHFV